MLLMFSKLVLKTWESLVIGSFEYSPLYLAGTFAGDSEYLFEYIFAYWSMFSIWDVFIEANLTVLKNKIFQKT